MRFSANPHQDRCWDKLNVNKNILLIGTGAISELLYLPLLAGSTSWRPLVRCVDRDAVLMQRNAARHGLALGGTDYRPLLPEAAVAIIATPPRSHYPIAKDCLEAGLHVILEKPLTDTHTEAVKLVELARMQKRLLMVNNTRRLFQGYAEIHRILAMGELGGLLEIDYAEGGAFAWPTASGFYFDAKQGGRGVISDRGSHVLDLFCWWAGAQPELVECRTDVDGGVEGFCDVRLRLSRGQARMRLSWHNKLANRVRVRCERGEITTGIYDFREVTVIRNGQAEKRTLPAEEKAFEDYGLSFARRALTAALEGGAPPVNGADVVPSLALLDDCYARAQRLDFPWLYQHSPKV